MYNSLKELNNIYDLGHHGDNNFSASILKSNTINDSKNINYTYGNKWNNISVPVKLDKYSVLFRTLLL
jgi:hypothetical protein